MITDQKRYISEKNKTLILLGLDKERVPGLFDALEGTYVIASVTDEDDVLKMLNSSLERIAAVLFAACLMKCPDFKLISRLDEDKRFVEIPVIAVSADCGGECRRMCIDAGVNEFFEPPFKHDILPLRIRNAARAKDSVTFHEMEIMLRELPSNIYFKDRDGRYIFSSHYWHHLNGAGGSGWTIRGKTDYDIQKDATIAEKAFNSDKNIISTGVGTSYILEINTDNVQEFLQVIKSPTYDNKGDVSGIIAIMNDVTELELLKRKFEDHSEQLDAELRVAAQIQLNMMPMAFENNKNIAISVSMTPAKNVGGDFYDYFFIDDDHIALVMADVSGKGMPAALGMTITKIVLHDRALTGGTPAEIVADANNRICANNRMQLFITVWFGILDLKTGTVTYTNAGHEYPAVKRSDSDNFELVVTDNFPPIGTVEDIQYEDGYIELGDSGSLFLYTDGVTDVKSAEGKRFGIDRALGLLNRLSDNTPHCVIDTLCSEIEGFVGDTPRFDDTTMMFVKYNA